MVSEVVDVLLWQGINVYPMLEYLALNSSCGTCSYKGWSSTTIIWWTSSDPLIGRVEGLERAWRVVASGSN